MFEALRDAAAPVADLSAIIRTDRYKYIRNFETAFAVEVPADIQAGPIFRSDPSRYSRDRSSITELYDLETDPLEMTNLAGRPEVAKIERELRLM